MPKYDSFQDFLVDMNKLSSENVLNISNLQTDLLTKTDSLTNDLTQLDLKMDETDEKNHQKNADLKKEMNKHESMLTNTNTQLEVLSDLLQWQARVRREMIERGVSVDAELKGIKAKIGKFNEVANDNYRAMVAN